MRSLAHGSSACVLQLQNAQEWRIWQIKKNHTLRRFWGNGPIYLPLAKPVAWAKAFSSLATVVDRPNGQSAISFPPVPESPLWQIIFLSKTKSCAAWFASPWHAKSRNSFLAPIELLGWFSRSWTHWLLSCHSGEKNAGCLDMKSCNNTDHLGARFWQSTKGISDALSRKPRVRKGFFGHDHRPSKTVKAPQACILQKQCWACSLNGEWMSVEGILMCLQFGTQTQNRAVSDKAEKAWKKKATKRNSLKKGYEGRGRPESPSAFYQPALLASAALGTSCWALRQM